MRVDEHTITLDDSPVFYRSAMPPPRSSIAPLYVHGVPTSSDDWTPLLELTGGFAVDLIGFGRSGKGGHLDYTAQGLASFLGAFADHLGLEQLQLVAHGWGVVAAVLFASAAPQRVDRVALIAPSAALPGSRWTRVQRALCVPGLGELLMGSTTRMMLRRTLRGASASPSAWPEKRVESVWSHFDQGTQRATLRLHRTWNPDRERALESALRTLAMPALLLWGDTDPWCRPELAQAYADRLPQARLEEIPDAGHWPWLDVQDVAQRVSAWLDG